MVRQVGVRKWILWSCCRQWDAQHVGWSIQEIIWLAWWQLVNVLPNPWSDFTIHHSPQTNLVTFSFKPLSRMCMIVLCMIYCMYDIPLVGLIHIYLSMCCASYLLMSLFLNETATLTTIETDRYKVSGTANCLGPLIMIQLGPKWFS